MTFKESIGDRIRCRARINPLARFSCRVAPFLVPANLGEPDQGEVVRRTPLPHTRTDKAKGNKG